MENNLNEKEKKLITELLSYTRFLSKKNLEHLVWIGEGMHYATKNENKESKGDK